MSDLFYDTERLSKRHEDEKNEDEDSRMRSILSSRSKNKNIEPEDDVSTVKHMWAFNLPCALLVNGGRKYWREQIFPIYQILYKDHFISVRKSLSAGLIEVAKMLELQDESHSDSQ